MVGPGVTTECFALLFNENGAGIHCPRIGWYSTNACARGMSMIRALGKNVRIRQGDALTKHDFPLPLTDLLLEMVEQDTESEHALWYSHRACALVHDVVNMATMTGQLLWQTSVAPVRTGTPDSLFISMLAESFFVQARSACDVIAEVILKLCIDPKKRGQLPPDNPLEGNSFRPLLNWVIKHPTRIPGISFVAEHEGWFSDLVGIRDKLVHLGYDILVFTNAIAPSFGLTDSGAAALHFLRAPRTKFPDGPRLVRLLPVLKRITQGVLTLSSQVADAIAQERGHTSEGRNVLNGVYIPALYHLLSYEEPHETDITPEEEQRRTLAAWYLLEVGDYLNAILVGYPDGFWIRFAVRLAERYGRRPTFVSEPKCPPYRDGEELALWRLGFTHDGVDHMVALKDAAHMRFDATEGSHTDAEVLQRLRNSPYGPTVAVLVVNTSSLSVPIPPEKMFDGLILETDPIKAADAAFMALTAAASPSEVA